MSLNELQTIRFQGQFQKIKRFSRNKDDPSVTKAARGLRKTRLLRKLLEVCKSDICYES